MGVHDSVVRGQRFEFVGSGDKAESRQVHQFGGDLDGKAWMRVQPRADRGATQRKLAQMRQGIFQMSFAMAELRDPPGDLLA